MNRDVSREVRQADLGDARLSRRAGLVVDALAETPQASFPEVFVSDAALEATYRLLRNPKVSMEALLEPHLRLTAAYAGLSGGTIVVAHDTTAFNFSGAADREGLGRVSCRTTGFMCHVSFAMSLAGELCSPLGVIEAHQWVRTGPSKGQRSCAQVRNDPTNEAERWIRTVQRVEQRFGESALGAGAAVHVMDREGDNYRHFVEMIEQKSRFVVRGAYDRETGTRTNPVAISDVDFSCSTVLHRQVKLSPRKNRGTQERSHPSRRSRVAEVNVVGKAVTLLRPKQLLTEVRGKVTINFVRVTESNCPEGEPTVEWRLWTTEPIETQQDLARVVDLYRARWLIEEFFKALKTGCSYESRQLESRRTLTNALGLFIPIATNLLKVRTLARGPSPERKASEIFTHSAIEVLRAVSPKPLPLEPTAHDALHAIAKIGGHISRNGDPGWLVLWRGYEKFLFMQQGWDAARLSVKPPGDRIFAM